jgi:hypothetical protein
MKQKNFVKNEFIAVYTDYENDRFSFGKVIACDENYLIIHSIDPAGLENGLTLFRIEDIYKIERKTPYFEKLFALMKYKNVTLPTYNFISNDYLVELLNNAKSTNTVIGLQINNSHTRDVLGYITEINCNTCEIKQIDNYGEYDGLCTVDIDNITSIIYNNLEDRDAHFLYMLKNKK